jgi:hypothetical protein
VVWGNKDGWYALAETTPDVPANPAWDACNLGNPNVQLKNLPGEFIFDVQSHHVMPDRPVWRASPYTHAFICGLFAGTNGNMLQGPEQDPCEAVGRWNYFKNIYLDSSTTCGVLSPVPYAPDEIQPLPFRDAEVTANMIENATDSQRVVTHGYVMPHRGRSPRPNRVADGQPGGLGDRNGPLAEQFPLPPFHQDELDWMEERAWKYGRTLHGWKVYLASGEPYLVSGAFHDEPLGMSMNRKILEIWKKYGIPPVLASHKGVQLPSQDARCNATDDVPAAAKAFPDIRFVFYHSAGGGSEPYPTDVGKSDTDIDITDRAEGTNGLIKNLRRGGLDARKHIPKGLAHGNTPNVSVDLGSVTGGGPAALASFLAKMVYHIGARRICYGTDAIWGGSPQGIIVALRTVQMGDDIKKRYNLPYGFEGDRFDPRVNTKSGSSYTLAYLTANPSLKDPKIGGKWPTDGKPHPERSIRNGILGRNAADIYEVNADAKYKALSCDRLQEMRNGYVSDQIAGLGDYVPRDNVVYGPRTRAEVIKMVNEDWRKNGYHA